MNKIILIDDDKLIHMMWKMEADKADLDLYTFFSVKEFLEMSDSFPREIKIYIDSNLGDNLKGEIESEKISNLGFTNLYLTTGHDPTDINRPKWIVEIIGKRPFFD